MIKDEELKGIYEQISQGMSGLYNFFNYVEDLDMDEAEKELMHERSGNATYECFAVLGFIHVINESWKLPGGGHVPLERKKDGEKSRGKGE